MEGGNGSLNNIENRVVEMKFDNAQFEQAVAKTMQTLDKFKEKLNFEGSGKGLDKLGKAADDYQYTLNDVGRAVDNIAGQMANMESLGNMAFMRLKNAALDFAQNGLKKVIGDVMEGGMSRAMNLEQAKFQLEGILGSAEEVNRVIYSDILPELQGTPFSLDQAAVVMGQLAASGKTTSEEVQQGTRAIAGAAAMTNSSFADMGRIFTKVAGNGRVMGDTLQEMSSRGLNAAADMGKVFDMTEAEVREAVTAGEISYDMFAEAMDQLYGAQAKKSTTMYTGALEDLRAALARIGAEPMAVKLEFLRDAFNALVPAVDAVNSVFKPFTSSTKELEEYIDENGDKVTRYAKPFAGTLAANVQKAGWSFQELFVRLDENKDILRYNEDNWKELGLQIEKNEDGTVSYFETLADGRKVYHDFGEAVMNPDMYRIVTAAAQTFVNVIAALGNLLGAIGKGIIEAFPKLALSNIADVTEGIQKFTKAFVFSKPVLTSIQAIVRAIFTPLGLLARLLIIVGKVAVEVVTMAYRAIKPFAKVVLSSVGMAAQIFSGFGSILDQAAQNITWFASKVYGGLKSIAQFLRLDYIFTKLQVTMNKLSSAMTKGGTKIYGFFSNFSSKIHGFGKTIYELLRLDEVSAAFIRFKARMTELMRVTGRLGLDRLIAGFKNMVEVIRSYIRVFKPVGNIVDMMKAFGLGIVSMVPTDKIINGIDRFTNFMTRLGLSIATYIAPYIVKAAQGMSQFAFSIGRFFKNLHDAGSIQVAIRVIGILIKDLIGYIPKLMGFKSFGDIFDKIKSKIAGFIDVFKTFMTAMAGGGKAKAQDFGKNISNSFKGIGDSKMVKRLSGFGDVIKKLGAMFSGVAGNLGDKIKAFYKALEAGDKKKIVAALSMLAMSFSYIRTIAKVKKTFEAAEDTINLFKGLGHAFTEAGNAFKKVGNSFSRMTMLIGITTSLLIFAGALAILSKMNMGDLIQGGIATIGALLALSLSMALLNKIKIDPNNKKKLLEMGGAMAAIGAAVLMVTKSMTLIAAVYDSHSPEQFLAIIGTLAGMMVAFGLLAFEFSKIDKMEASLKSAGLSMIAISTAIKIMVSAIQAIGTMDLDTLKQGGIAVAALFGLMAALAIFTGKSTGFGDVGSSLLKVATSLLILWAAINVYASIDLLAFASGLLKLGATLLVVLGVFKLFGEVAGPKNAIGLLGVAFAVVVFAGALTVLSMIPFTNLIQGIAGLVVVLVAIGAAMAVLSYLGAGMAIVGASFALLGIAFLAAGAGAMLLTMALATLVPLLMLLSNVDQSALAEGLNVIKMIADELAKSFRSLAGGVLAFGAALLVAAIAVVVLAAGVVVLGLGFAACGVGLLLLAGGLATIALVVDAFFGGELLNKIGSAFESFGSAIVSGLGGLIQKAKGFFSKDKGKDTVKSYMDGMKEAADGDDDLKTSMDEKAEEASNAFGEKKEEFKGILSGWMSEGGDVIAADKSKLLDPMDSLGIDMTTTTESNLGDVTSLFGNFPGDAGNAILDNKDQLSGAFGDLFSGGGIVPTEDLKKSIGDSAEQVPKAYGDSIKKNKKKATKPAKDMYDDIKKPYTSTYSDFKDYGHDAANGFKKGIDDYAEKCAKAAADMVRKAKRAAKDEQDSHSPSKEFAKLGRWADEGYIVGLRSLSGKVAMAARDMVSGGINSVSDAMSIIADASGVDLDFNPTITPVVDLENVRKSADGINDILGGSFGLSTPLTGMMNAQMAASGFQNRGDSPEYTAINKLAKRIGDMTDTMNSRSLNNYITVDGAADPEGFADDLIRSFRLNARTL